MRFDCLSLPETFTHVSNMPEDEQRQTISTLSTVWNLAVMQDHTGVLNTEALGEWAGGDHDVLDALLIMRDELLLYADIAEHYVNSVDEEERYFLDFLSDHPDETILGLIEMIDEDVEFDVRSQFMDDLTACTISELERSFICLYGYTFTGQQEDTIRSKVYPLAERYVQECY